MPASKSFTPARGTRYGRIEQSHSANGRVIDVKYSEGSAWLLHCPSPSLMKFTSYLTKYYAVTIVVILLIAAVTVPYPAEEVPEWKILLIDENYLPGGGRTLVQKVENSYFGHSAEYKAVTDKNGFATLPARYMWAGFTRRTLSRVAAPLGWDTATKVSVSPESGTCPSGPVKWSPGANEMPDKLVCSY